MEKPVDKHWNPGGGTTQTHIIMCKSLVDHLMLCVHSLSIVSSWKAAIPPGGWGGGER